MICKAIAIPTKVFFIAILLLAFAAPQQLQAQDASDSRHWTVKLNLLSPVWKNVSGEVEYKIKPRLSLLAGFGVKRAFESLPEPTGWHCIESRGFGIAAGTKYFIAHREYGQRSVDGIALKTTLNYTFDDEIKQLCPSLLPMKMYRTRTFGLNTFLSAQKTFFDRLVVEAQAGIGGSLQHRIAKKSELLILYRNETLLDWHFPFAVNVGWTF